MFATLGLGSLVDPVQHYLTIRIGRVYFGPIDTCVLVAALATALVSVLKLWRISHCEAREKYLSVTLRGALLQQPQPPRTRRPPWYQRLGAMVAATPIIGPKKQRSLLRALGTAGFEGHAHLNSLIAVKVCGSAASVALLLLLLGRSPLFAGPHALSLAALSTACFMGWRLPEIVLSRIAARRRVRLELGMPDALDLLVICAEAGLSLDQAIEQVGRHLHSSSPELAREFTATASEMRVLADRRQALDNFALRSGISSFRSIVATLNQSVKFGTPLAESLRVLAAEMRAQRLARLEERAARLPALLSFPLIAFILPSLLIVIGTPLVLHILDAWSMLKGKALW
jgi:tight adherence protein C